MDDPYYQALLADAYLRSGRYDAASAAAEDGIEEAPNDRRFFFESELHRAAGEALLGLGRRDEAETRMRQALELARLQNSPALELRAALSLATQLGGQDQIDEARDLTTGVYSTFTEGFATADLVAARALLDQLGR